MTQQQFTARLVALLPRLKRFACSLTRSTTDADDLLQEACVVALQKHHLYSPSHPLEHWMFRVIRNLWISEMRSRKRQIGAGQVDAASSHDLCDPSDPEMTVTVGQIREMVDHLDPELGRPLMLVCDEGFSYREAAEALGVPIGTIMSRIHRARQSLMARLPAEQLCAD